MLTFLRKIRKSLVESGSSMKPPSPVTGGQSLAPPLEPALAARGWRRLASRYLLYAIGEIALVVIGILIALQINNWNEDRKEQDLEIEYLNGIKQD